MYSWKSLVIGCLVGLLVGASLGRADVAPPYIDELRRIASALEKANDHHREQARATEHVADEIGRCR
jgi:hypothetical protein